CRQWEERFRNGSHATQRDRLVAEAHDRAATTLTICLDEYVEVRRCVVAGAIPFIMITGAPSLGRSLARPFAYLTSPALIDGQRCVGARREGGVAGPQARLPKSRDGLDETYQMRYTETGIAWPCPAAGSRHTREPQRSKRGCTLHNASCSPADLPHMETPNGTVSAVEALRRRRVADPRRPARDQSCRRERRRHSPACDQGGPRRRAGRRREGFQD